jgi:hypothetical protein
MARHKFGVPAGDGSDDSNPVARAGIVNGLLNHSGKGSRVFDNQRGLPLRCHFTGRANEFFGAG